MQHLHPGQYSTSSCSPFLRPTVCEKLLRLLLYCGTMKKDEKREELLAPSAQMMNETEATTSDRYHHLEAFLENSRVLGAETLSSLYCQREMWMSAADKLDEMAVGLHNNHRRPPASLTSLLCLCCWPWMPLPRQDEQASPQHPPVITSEAAATCHAQQQAKAPSRPPWFSIEAHGEDLSLHDDVNLQLVETSQSVHTTSPAQPTSRPSRADVKQADTAALQTGDTNGTADPPAGSSTSISRRPEDDDSTSQQVHQVEGGCMRLPSALEQQMEAIGQMALVLGEELNLQGDMLESLQQKTEGVTHQIKEKRKAIP